MNKFVLIKNYPDIYTPKSSYIYLGYELMIYDRCGSNHGELNYASDSNDELELKSDFREYVNFKEKNQ